MKSFAAATLACAAAAENLFVQDNLAHIISPTSDANGIIDFEKIVLEWVESEFLTDYNAQADYINNVTKTIKSQKNFVTNDQPIYTCGSRQSSDLKDKEAFDFLPVFAAQLTEANPTSTYEGTCFEEINFSLVKTSETTFDVNIDLLKPKSLICNEKFLIANTEVQHFSEFMERGSHKVSLTMDTTDAQTDFGFGGVKVYMFCDSIVTEVESLLRTLECFVGGISDHPKIPIIGSHVPPYMAHANINFLHEAMGLTIEERTITDVDVDESLFKSGDFFLIMRLDGLDPMIMWGTGAHGAHCVMTMWFTEEDGTEALYIVESQDAWYWPTAGI